MSLLTICQNAATEVGVYDAPLSIVGNNSDDAIKLLALANRTGREIMKKHNWTRLQTEATITTIASTEAYALESDFDRFINNTMWDNSNNREMKLVTEQEWAFLKNGIVTQAGIEKQWRIRGQNVLVHPTPAGADTLKYE